MKYALLIAVALAMVLSSALGAEITSLTNLEQNVPVAGTSADRAYYDWWHSDANAIGGTPSTSTTPLARDMGELSLVLKTDAPTQSGFKTSTLTNAIETDVYGKAVLGPDGQVQTLRTGFYMGGSLFDYTKPATVTAGWDPELGTIWAGDWEEKAGFTRNEYGWMSGKITSNDVCADDWYNDAQLMVKLPGDEDAATITLNDGTQLKAGLEDPVVEKIVAHGDRLDNTATQLYEAYAGASQTGSIKDIKDSSEYRVSGYGDFYGGFLDAFIDPSKTGTNDYDNRIEFELINELAGEPGGQTSGTNGPRPEWVWWVDN